MAYDEETSAIFMGAIFMCNRRTKKECLRRKLFGLPSSYAELVKKVEVGMFLFLFEHEERILYGVFEATSAGALNLVPGAFSNSFPAQVHFKSLRVCAPLSEDEFRSAIQENYFTRNKFHFDLTYKQVGKLLGLFESKKISPHYSQSIDYHSNYRSENNKITGSESRDRSLSFDSTGCCEKNNEGSKSGLGCHSMYNQNSDHQAQISNTGIENRLAHHSRCNPDNQVYENCNVGIEQRSGHHSRCNPDNQVYENCDVGIEQRSGHHSRCNPDNQVYENRDVGIEQRWRHRSSYNPDNPVYENRNVGIEQRSGHHSRYDPDNIVYENPNAGIEDRSGYHSGYNQNLDRPVYENCNVSIEDRSGYHASYDQNPNLPVYGNPTVGIEQRSYPNAPYPIHSMSQIDRPHRGNFRDSPKTHPFHRNVPCIEGQPPTYDLSSAANPDLAQKYPETQALHYSSHLYSSHPASKILGSSCTKYLKHGNFNDELGADMPNSRYSLSETQASRFSSLSYPSQRSSYNLGLVDYLPIQKENYGSFDYDPKYHATNLTDRLHDVQRYTESSHEIENTREGYTEASHEIDSARGARYWTPCADNTNLPLVEEKNTVVDMGIPRYQNEYSSDPSNAYKYEENDYHLSKGSPTPVISNQGRTSVFSRLSNVPKQSISPRDDFCEEEKNCSSDLLRLLSHRRNQKTRATSKRLSERLKNVDQMKPICAEVASESKDFNEEGMEPPILNFKRRSGAQNTGDEGTNEKCKRRKLVRPCFTEDHPLEVTSKERKIIYSSSEKKFGMKSPFIIAENDGHNGEHVNPGGKVEGSRGSLKEGAKTVRDLLKLPICFGDEGNLDKIPNASNKHEGIEQHSSGADFKCDGSISNVIREKKRSFDGNSKHNSRGSAVNKEGNVKRSKQNETGEKNRGPKQVSPASVGAEGKKSDLVYETTTMLPDVESKETCRECDAITKSDSTKTEEKRMTELDLNRDTSFSNASNKAEGIEQHMLSADINFQGGKLDKIGKRGRMSDGNPKQVTPESIVNAEGNKSDAASMVTDVNMKETYHESDAY